MKILHLIGGGDVGGAKTHVLSLLKELSKKTDVKLISFRKGSFSDEAKSIGINVEVIHSGFIFLDIFRVVRIIKSEGFDIIHSHGSKANMIGAIVKFITGLPAVTTIHSDYRLDYMQSILKRFTFGVINAIALRFIDYYINVSKNLKEILFKRSFNKDKIFSLRNGIDFENRDTLSRFEFSDKYNLDLKENEIVVGILARLTTVKGLEIFLDAAKCVVEKDNKIKFLIGGDGEDRKMLEEKAKTLGISQTFISLDMSIHMTLWPVLI